MTDTLAASRGGEVEHRDGALTPIGYVEVLAVRLVASRTVLDFNPADSLVTPARTLPVAATNAAAAVVGGTAFLVGGNNGHRQVPPWQGSAWSSAGD